MDFKVMDCSSLYFECFGEFQGPPDLKKSSLNPPEGLPDLICPTLFPNVDCKYCLVFV